MKLYMIQLMANKESIKGTELIVILPQSNAQ